MGSHGDGSGGKSDNVFKSNTIDLRAFLSSRPANGAAAGGATRGEEGKVEAFPCDLMSKKLESGTAGNGSVSESAAAGDSKDRRSSLSSLTGKDPGAGVERGGENSKVGAAPGTLMSMCLCFTC